MNGANDEGPVTVRQLLREERDRQLERVPWPAFSAQVMGRLDSPLPADLTQAAVETLRQDVDAERTAFAARSAAFRDQVEGRIFSEGMRRRTPWVATLRSWWARPVRSWTLAGAAAAVAAVWLWVGPVASNGGPGPVTVDELSFEGTALVVAEEGMTVVWLQDS